MNNLNLKVGVITGFAAVLVTTVTNILGRSIGLLPEPMDLKYMAEFIVDPASAPTTAFWLGIIFHIAGGILVGIFYAWLIKRPTPLNGIIFTVICVWLPMMLVVMPVSGRGFFGMNVGTAMIVATFILNILYGVVAGLVAQRLTTESRPLAGSLS